VICLYSCAVVDKISSDAERRATRASLCDSTERLCLLVVTVLLTSAAGTVGLSKPVVRQNINSSTIKYILVYISFVDFDTAIVVYSFRSIATSTYILVILKSLL